VSKSSEEEEKHRKKYRKSMLEAIIYTLKAFEGQISIEEFMNMPFPVFFDISNIKTDMLKAEKEKFDREKRKIRSGK